MQLVLEVHESPHCLFEGLQTTPAVQVVPTQAEWVYTVVQSAFELHVELHCEYDGSHGTLLWQVFPEQALWVYEFVSQVVLFVQLEQWASQEPGVALLTPLHCAVQLALHEPVLLIIIHMQEYSGLHDAELLPSTQSFAASPPSMADMADAVPQDVVVHEVQDAY